MRSFLLSSTRLSFIRGQAKSKYGQCSVRCVALLPRENRIAAAVPMYCRAKGTMPTSKIPSGGNGHRNEISRWEPSKKERDLRLLIHQKNEEIENLKKKIDYQAGDIDSLKKRIAELEEEVRQLKETLTSLQGDRNILLIGEVCRKFQANLYQYVFPGKRISPYYSYKMSNLEQDIEKSKSESVKYKAKELWKELKDKEDPERFQTLVEELQKLRNATAHFDKIELDVKDVLKAAEKVNEEGDFEFLDRTEFNFEDVKKLIEMWGRTEQYVKVAKASTSA